MSVRADIRFGNGCRSDVGCHIWANRNTTCSGDRTVSVNEHVFELPLESTTVVTMVWSPGPKMLPEGGSQVTVTELSQLSAAKGVLKLTAPSHTVPSPRLARWVGLSVPLQSGCRLSSLDAHPRPPSAGDFRNDLKFSQQPRGQPFRQRLLLLSSHGLTPSELQPLVMEECTTAPHCHCTTTPGLSTAK